MNISASDVNHKQMRMLKKQIYVRRGWRQVGLALRICPFYSKDNSWKNNSITDEIYTFLWGRTHWLWDWHISFDVRSWNLIVSPSWHGSPTGNGLWLTLPSRPRKSQTSPGIPLSPCVARPAGIPRNWPCFYWPCPASQRTSSDHRHKLMEDSIKEFSNWCFLLCKGFYISLILQL